jgi:hypothetical protein
MSLKKYNMGRFHEILEEEHIKFCNSLDGQYFLEMMNNSEQYVRDPEKFLNESNDFDE